MLELYDITFRQIYDVIREWKWCELQKGCELSIIKKEDVLLYAGWMAEEGTKDLDLILELIINEDLDSILPELLKREEKSDPETICSKWIFAIILVLFNQNRKDIFSLIEDIYVEFNYPEEISQFISYMPKNEAAEERKELLIKYIEANKKKWCG